MALVIVVALGIALSAWELVQAQDGTPEPEPEVDFCLVSLSAETTTLRAGEPLRVWVWGVGVEPGSWDLELDGDSSLALRGARNVASWAEMVEWTFTGATEGQVTISASMTCRESGNGVDSLTLTVLPAEPEGTPTPQSAANFCTTHLSLSDQQVQVGDGFYAWFVGAGTGPRSWNLSMSGEGSARVVGTRELDSEYVEWELKAVSPGILRLTGAMDCTQPGDGASTGEVAIVESSDESAESNPLSWFRTQGTVATVEAALLVVLVAVLAALVYLLIRRPR